MNQPNPIETWLTTVAYSHSQSQSTEYAYKKNMEDFCKSQHTTPEEILTDYETTDEKTFKHKHSQQIQQWITTLYKQKMTTTTINAKISAIKSFYKYNSLPLGYIPQAKGRITYHNRDIEAKEIAQIIDASQPREQAIYAIMAKSGLRPFTIQKLKINNIENLNQDQTEYQITIDENITKGKFGSHITFIDQEAKKYLKKYLSTRQNINEKELLFCAYEEPNIPINTKNTSRSFQHSARKLQKTGALNYEIRENGKPSEIRLYTLRKFFKRMTKEIGDEDTNYLMGHIQDNYAPKNPEYYRTQYKKIIPNLRLETPTPTEAETQMTELRKQYENKNKELTDRLEKIENRIFPKQQDYEIPDEIISFWEKQEQEQIKWEKEHPDEVKRREEQATKTHQKYEKYLDKHPQERKQQEEQDEKFYREHLETRINELEKMIKDLQIILKKDKETKN